MEKSKKIDLKERIMGEMVVEQYNILEENFDLAKRFMRITKEGKIEVIVKDKLSGAEQILLYFIGKLYAKEAGLSENGSVGNKELMEELGIIENSLYPLLKSLRETNKIKKIKIEGAVHHTINIKIIEKTLEEIGYKIEPVF